MFCQRGLRPGFPPGNLAPEGWRQPGFRAHLLSPGDLAGCPQLDSQHQRFLLQPCLCPQKLLKAPRGLRARGSSRGPAQTRQPVSSTGTASGDDPCLWGLQPGERPGPPHLPVFPHPCARECFSHSSGFLTPTLLPNLKIKPPDRVLPM